MISPTSTIACFMITLGLLCVLSPQKAVAQDTLNDMIQPGIAAETTTHAVPEVAPSDDMDAEPERWIERTEVIDNLRVLTVRPMLNASCEDLLFELGQPLIEDFDVPQDGALDIDMSDLCFLGFRNSSNNRHLLIKLSDQFRAISILPDSRLITGLALGAKDEILAPVRVSDSELKTFDFRVATIWMDQMSDETVDPDNFILHLYRR